MARRLGTVSAEDAPASPQGAVALKYPLNDEIILRTAIRLLEADKRAADALKKLTRITAESTTG